MNDTQKLAKLSLSIYFSVILSILILSSYNTTQAFESTDPTKSTPNIVIAINPGAMDYESQHPFNQSKVTVPVGTNVTWINNDRTLHTIVSGDPENGPSNIFYSPLFDNKETYTFIFTKPGIYPYYDTSWTHMTGQVEVVESVP